MDDLLTTKQLQELLHVDRVTIYRMLKDGRLKGVKIGKQWRFHRQGVEALISGAPSAAIAGAPPAFAPAPLAVDIPLNCTQTIQDVFAEIAGVGAVTTNPDGTPLTGISNCSNFCNLIQNSKTGHQACAKVWRQLATHPEPGPQFVTCHAGLQCARACITANNVPAGVLIAGQFYTASPESNEEQARIRQLARQHGLQVDALTSDARRLPVLDDYKRARISNWLERVARSFGKISRERADMISRLRHIAEVSAF